MDGQHIRTLRKSKGIKQSVLAEKAGVSIGFISDIESGKKSPSLNTLKMVAAALGVPMSELLDDDAPVQDHSAATGFRVPVLGRINSVCCGTGFDLSDVEPNIVTYEFIPESWVVGHITGPLPIYMVPVEGDSMSPMIEDGERILVNPNELEPAHGGVSLIRWNGRTLVRGVFFENAGISLRPVNKRYRDEFISYEDVEYTLEFCGMVLRKIPQSVPIKGML